MLNWVDRFDPQVEEIIHSSIKRSRAIGLNHRDEMALAAEALSAAMPNLGDVDASSLVDTAEDESGDHDWTVASENWVPDEDGDRVELDEWARNL